MRLLTLNTHSLVEENYPQKLHDFSAAVLRMKPDVIALQEVNQPISGEYVKKAAGYIPSQERVPLKTGNHALNVAKLLEEGGLKYFWSWLPMKIGYGIYDEGLAVLSRKPISQTQEFLISRVHTYRNWRTRRILGIKNEDGWFYSIHTSWWGDKDEPFLPQWQKLCGNVKGLENVWLMGDFNNPSQLRGEGYDLIIKSGWQDCFTAADEKYGDATASGAIDGWRERGVNDDGIRIDLILSDRKVKIRKCEVVFDGRNEAQVSDHYGVLAETSSEE